MFCLHRFAYSCYFLWMLLHSFWSFVTFIWHSIVKVHLSYSTFHSFSWLTDVLLYRCSTFWLSIHQLINTLVVSLFGSLGQGLISFAYRLLPERLCICWINAFLPWHLAPCWADSLYSVNPCWKKQGARVRFGSGGLCCVKVWTSAWVISILESCPVSGLGPLS